MRVRETTAGYILLVFLPLLASCSLIHPKDQYEDWSHFPESNQRIYYGMRDHGLFVGLDSLIAFTDTLRGFPKFKQNVHRFVIQRKHANDFALAYDGETAAINRLIGTVDSRDDDELGHLVWGLAQFDSTRVVKRLQSLLAKEVSSTRKESLRSELEWCEKHNRYAVEQQKKNDSYGARQREKINRVTTAEMDTVLNRGMRNDFNDPFNHVSDVLEAAMRGGSRDQYERAREPAIRVVDSLSGVREFTVEVIINRLLTIPAPGDSANSQRDICELFDAMTNGGISNDVFYDSLMGAWSRFRSDVIRIHKSSVVAIEPAVAFLLELYTDYKLFVDSGNSLVRYANRNGMLDYTKLSMKAYRDFASVEIRRDQAFPIWVSAFSCGSETIVPLRKVNGAWKIMGRLGWLEW